MAYLWEVELILNHGHKRLMITLYFYTVYYRVATPTLRHAALQNLAMVGLLRTWRYDNDMFSENGSLSKKWFSENDTIKRENIFFLRKQQKYRRYRILCQKLFSQNIE